MVVNRNYTNVSCKALGQLISLKDASSRTVSKNAVYNKEEVYYLPAIRLFISLNFKVSTQDGTATNLLIRDLAEEIGCCSKTILSSLNKLSSGSKPLISYHIDEDTKLLSVEFLNYKDMFKRRGEGGLGYIVMDGLMRTKLYMAESINDMRLLIRALLECTEQEGYEASISLKQLIKGLPSYIRPCNVRNSLDKFKRIFDLTPNRNKSAYHFMLNDMSRVKERKNALLVENEAVLREMVSSFNNTIDSINEWNSKDGTQQSMSPLVEKQVRDFLHVSFDWKSANEDGLKILPKFNFTSKEFEDAAQIATQLNADCVKGALKKYMEQFVLPGRGSKRRDTMAIIQNMSESIFTKTKTFLFNENLAADASGSAIAV